MNTTRGGKLQLARFHIEENSQLLQGNRKVGDGSDWFYKGQMMC